MLLLMFMLMITSGNGKPSGFAAMFHDYDDYHQVVDYEVKPAAEAYYAGDDSSADKDNDGEHQEIQHRSLLGNTGQGYVDTKPPIYEEVADEPKLIKLDDIERENVEVKHENDTKRTKRYIEDLSPYSPHKTVQCNGYYNGSWLGSQAVFMFAQEGERLTEILSTVREVHGFFHANRCVLHEANQTAFNFTANSTFVYELWYDGITFDQTYIPMTKIRVWADKYYWHLVDVRIVFALDTRHEVREVYNISEFQRKCHYYHWYRFYYPQVTHMKFLLPPYVDMYLEYPFYPKTTVPPPWDGCKNIWMVILEYVIIFVEWVMSLPKLDLILGIPICTLAATGVFYLVTHFLFPLIPCLRKLARGTCMDSLTAKSFHGREWEDKIVQMRQMIDKYKGKKREGTRRERQSSIMYFSTMCSTSIRKPIKK